MNLSELQSVKSKERQSDSLQRLRASFYADAGEFIAELRAERAAAVEAAEDPFGDDEVRRLSDDIETAQSTVEAIYDRRVGKVVKMASLAAADMPVDEEGLTAEESALFERLVAAIEENRREVMDAVDVDAGPGAEAGFDVAPDVTEEASVDAADLMGGDGDEEATAGSDAGGEPATPTADQETASEEEPASGPGDDLPPAEAEGGDGDVHEVPPADGPPGAEPPASAAAEVEADESADGDGDVPRTTVRITRDVGEIFGVDDRAYDLSADDVVTLPSANAEPLVADDAAEPLE